MTNDTNANDILFDPCALNSMHVNVSDGDNAAYKEKSKKEVKNFFHPFLSGAKAYVSIC
jgi:hypothetical protein